jgi:hypothetical protein
MAREIEPGVLAIDDAAIQGLHLIRLLPDGSDRLREDRDGEETPKSTIGVGFVAPIELAPAKRALTIAEGCQIAFKCDPSFASNNDPVSVRDGTAETGGAEPRIAEQSRSWRAAGGEREVMLGS